jgi:multidrug efflux pump subunit AcrA (membrane-fusion protein)
MTVTIQIQSYINPRATLVPRTAVVWEENRPWVRVRNGSTIERRGLRLGQANDKFYEVLEGLKPGETVILP